MQKKSLKGKIWQEVNLPKPLITSLAENFDIDEIIAKILAKKEVLPENVANFLSPRLKNSMPNPFCLKDMERATTRIIKAIKSKEQIAIFSDYDVDGATSSALLALYFEELGLKPLIHIPDRFKEGYGPNIDAFLSLQKQGANLIITTDCGTVAFEPLAQAKQAGIETIVIDHHISQEKMPEAVAVVNPNRIDCTSEGLGNLCAAGVCFFVIAAINMKLEEEGYFASSKIEKPNILKWLDIVALGTVCDVMKLQGVNRAFVKQGLKLMNKRNNLGISALLDVAGVRGKVSEGHLGFAIGPRINAGGRVGESSLGSKLLRSHNVEEVKQIAHRLNEYNKERQAIEKSITEEATEMAEAQVMEGRQFIFVYGEGWHQGIIGIIASRLKDKFNLPVAVGSLMKTPLPNPLPRGEGELSECGGSPLGSPAFAKEGLGGVSSPPPCGRRLGGGVESQQEGFSGKIKASARSIKGVDIGSKIAHANENSLLCEGGGHSQAAGFSIAVEQLQEFTLYIEQAIKDEVAHALANQTREYIAELPEHKNLIKLAESLEQLTPFGEGNSEPIFKMPDMGIEYISYIGQNAQHLKIGFERNSAIAGLSDVSKEARQASQKFAVLFWNYKESEDAIKDFMLNNRKAIFNLYIKISPELYNGTLKVKLVDAVIV